MFARIRIAPDRIDVTDGAALFAWPLLGIMAAYFGVEAAREWAAAMETGPGIQTLIATGASAATIVASRGNCR